jgi:thiamine pyrophosphate-dependent acetolactate synthase large subunit-like protein
MAKKKTTEENIKPIEEHIEIADINVNVGDIKKSIENVDTTINTDIEKTLEVIDEKIKEELKPLNDIKEQVNEIVSTEVLENAISKDPENAEAIIQNEIQKTETLKKEIEKIIKNTEVKKPKITSMTNWWNGMGYDF